MYQICEKAVVVILVGALALFKESVSWYGCNTGNLHSFCIQLCHCMDRHLKLKHQKKTGLDFWRHHSLILSML